MKKIILSAMVASSLVYAQGSEYQYEITPVVGKIFTKDHVELENHGAVGAFIGTKSDEYSIFDQLELGILGSKNVENINNNIEDRSVYRFMLDGLKEYTITDNFNLFGVVGLGYEKHNKKTPTDQSSVQFNYGIGAKYNLTDSVALRTDLRHLINFDSNKNILLSVGLSIAFGEIKKPEPKIEPKPVAVIEKKPEPVIEKKPEPKKVLPKPEEFVVYFDVASAKIKNNYTTKINNFNTYLEENNNNKVLVEGYTDTTGSKKYNKILSQKRTQNVSKLLEENGIDANKIIQEYYGEDFETASQETKETRQNNRKVTVSIK